MVKSFFCNLNILYYAGVKLKTLLKMKKTSRMFYKKNHIYPKICTNARVCMI